MRIALVVNPEIPVPPRLYGGIERIVAILIRGLARDGFDVTLFANPDSTIMQEVPGRLVPLPGRHSLSVGSAALNLAAVTSRVARGQFDVVHTFARVLNLLPLLPFPIPKIASFQLPIHARTLEIGSRLSRGSLHFVACSHYLFAGHPPGPNRYVIYNGAPAGQYTPTTAVQPDAPLVFLGRIEEIKGPHVAIEVARRTGRRLVIAGNRPAGHEAYFAERIAPRIDGDAVRYIGPVDDGQKNDVLGGAAALLMPVLWNEPFGIVMAEALACGTPVIAFPRGATPEVVQDGVNGFLCRDTEDMVQAVGRIGAIDRRTCRRIMEEKFSDRAIVAGYEELYRVLSRES